MSMVENQTRRRLLGLIGTTATAGFTQPASTTTDDTHLTATAPATQASPCVEPTTVSPFDDIGRWWVTPKPDTATERLYFISEGWIGYKEPAQIVRDTNGKAMHNYFDIQTLPVQQELNLRYSDISSIHAGTFWDIARVDLNETAIIKHLRENGYTKDRTQNGIQLLRYEPQHKPPNSGWLYALGYRNYANAYGTAVAAGVTGHTVFFTLLKYGTDIPTKIVETATNKRPSLPESHPAYANLLTLYNDHTANQFQYGNPLQDSRTAFVEQYTANINPYKDNADVRTSGAGWVAWHYTSKQNTPSWTQTGKYITPLGQQTCSETDTDEREADVLMTFSEKPCKPPAEWTLPTCD